MRKIVSMMFLCLALPGADAEGFALVPQSHAVGAATAIVLFALQNRRATTR
jgi:hypothetical protein